MIPQDTFCLTCDHKPIKGSENSAYNTLYIVIEVGLPDD